MSLNNTIKQLRDLLNNISSDLEKAENGNKAASQRVRTGTVRLEKVAKQYRKESISNEKKSKEQKKPAKASASKLKAKASASKSSAKPSSSKVKAKPKAKASFNPRQMSVKRPTAKLPTKKMAFR